MDLSVRKVPREVVTTVEEEEFTLTLSREEAAALYAVVGNITGHTVNDNPRKVVTSDLWRSLGHSGLDWDSGDVFKYRQSIQTMMHIS